MSQLELDLYNDMLRIYKEAEIQCNYKPTRLREMLLNQGGLKTAKKLISKNGGTDGFVRLWECHRLDLSVEALVLNDKYKELFTEEDMNVCRDKLKEYGYEF
ncbi:hypothetical protein [Clostridium uliginosum]|uniref:Uncharacterized protein n=1 Tax=Clostridium uliginosum TaxID=119641 RepID=A0A1I1JHB8_9CLOT|nr:hypothetical protein [Clostridium uliginosum]SFC47907.1 hypothetical protein SAMN05421842_10432 [Clostridium uliginosum]